MKEKANQETNSDSDALLKKNLEVAEESLKLSQKIYRDIIYRRIFAAIKWVVIVVLIVWGIIQLQPLIEQSTTIFDSIFETTRTTPQE